VCDGCETAASVADLVFSVCAGIASLAVSVLAAVKGVYWVSGVWALVAVGFSLRAAHDWRRIHHR
jgi:hypothetical protein